VDRIDLELPQENSLLSGRVPALMLGGRSHELFFIVERSGVYVLVHAVAGVCDAAGVFRLVIGTLFAVACFHALPLSGYR